MSWLRSTPTILRRALRHSLGSVLLFGLAATAHADSDGYYCVGDGYVAYQLRAALTAGVSGAHVLRVVRYGGDGVAVAGEVVLPDFQPHKLICSDNQVRIGGWMGRPVEYVIDVSGKPQIAFEVSDPGQAMHGSTMHNLGAWAQQGSVSLPSADRAHHYRLVITITTENVDGGLLHRVRTVIEQVDQDGAVADRLELYSGVREESVD